MRARPGRRTRPLPRCRSWCLRPPARPGIDKAGQQHRALGVEAERRTMAPGTARKPAARNRASSQPRNLESTLSHHTASPGAPAMIFMSLSRKDNSTAFFSHSCTRHSPPIFSATRSTPLSRPASASSTASRAAPGCHAERVACLPGGVDACRPDRSCQTLMLWRNWTRSVVFMVDHGIGFNAEILGRSFDQGTSVFSHTVVMPRSLAAIRLRAMSSNIAAALGTMPASATILS